MKNSSWNDIYKPIVVLGTICVLSSAALAGANLVTAPIIAEKAESTANAAYLEVLPEADGFEAVTDFETTGVQAVMKAKNGAGWAIRAAAKGFDGDVPVIVGFDAEGTIQGVKFTENTESPGYGQRLVDGSEDGLRFADQFKGLSGEQKLGDTVDGLSGATKSSKAAVAAVNAAVAAFNEVALGQGAVIVEETPQLTLPEAIEQLAGGPAEEIEAPEGTKAAYKNGDITVLVAGGAGYTNQGYGDPAPLTVAVGFDGAGSITGVWVDASKQTQGIGDQVAEKEFTDKFLGIVGEEDLNAVDAIGGATESSVGVKKAVRKCVKAFAQMTQS